MWWLKLVFDVSHCFCSRRRSAGNPDCTPTKRDPAVSTHPPTTVCVPAIARKSEESRKNLFHNVDRSDFRGWPDAETRPCSPHRPRCPARSATILRSSRRSSGRSWKSPSGSASKVRAPRATRAPRFEAASRSSPLSRCTHPFDAQSRSIDVLNHRHPFYCAAFLLCCLGSYPTISHHDFRATHWPPTRRR